MIWKCLMDRRSFLKFIGSRAVIAAVSVPAIASIAKTIEEFAPIFPPVRMVLTGSNLRLLLNGKELICASAEFTLNNIPGPINLLEQFKPEDITEVHIMEKS